MNAKTIQEALQSATADLSAVGVDTPRLDAQLLLAWVLKARREDLARAPEQILSDRDSLVYAKAVSLRVLRRPLPYITGQQWFYGRPFKINRAVLIPRPETELLVSAALEKTRNSTTPQIADIGTGSGILAVTLACERPDALVWATDLSTDALKTARKNIVRHGVENRVQCLQGDLLAPLPHEMRFDVIVSNPPYVREDELLDLQPEVRDYEPVLALSGLPGATGATGTALHRRLLHDAQTALKPGGWLLLEVGQGQAEPVVAYARALGWANVAIQTDFADIGRVVTAQRPENGSLSARLAQECAKLNVVEEQALADIGLAEEIAQWPEY